MTLDCFKKSNPPIMEKVLWSLRIPKESPLQEISNVLSDDGIMDSKIQASKRERKGQGPLFHQPWLVDAAVPESSVTRTVVSVGAFHPDGYSTSGCRPISGH